MLYLGKRGFTMELRQILARLSCNLQLLKQTLDKPRRKLLLRVCDDYDLLHALAVEESYKNGARSVLRLLWEESIDKTAP